MCETVNVTDFIIMKHGTSSRRQRSRNSGHRNNQQRAQVYNSNGPDVRIRGTAHQVAEKYLALARDASSAGDIIVAENYYQHAEHYIRVINENNGKFDAAKVFGKREEQENIGNRSNAAQNNSSGVDDLSLPSSIVGESVKKKFKEPEAVG